MDERIRVAKRGNEILGNDIFKSPPDNFPADIERAPALMDEMHNDQPTGGEDVVYGPKDSHRVRLWRSEQPAPVVLFVHGGSWEVGTYLDSIGSVKVGHLLRKGYAVASVDYTLFPEVEVEEQVQECANALAYLVRNGAELGIDALSAVLMGHSSGAHVVALLGADPKYLDKAGLPSSTKLGVICLDGSNYNAQAELFDSPGSVADHTTGALGFDPAYLQSMSPTFQTSSKSPASAVLLLHVQRQGDVRQAVEFACALRAAGIDQSLHVFEGEGFEGHVQMLLRLGLPKYPATTVMDKWLDKHIPLQGDAS